MATIQGTGPYFGPAGFDRGMQSTAHCGNNPESWLRGSATLDTSTGDMTITIQLETDSVAAGPKGRVKVTVKDENDSVLATVETDEIGMGGKPPGAAVQKSFTSTAQIPAGVAQNAKKLWVDPICNGQVNQWFGIDFSQIQKAFKTVVAIVGAA